MKADMVRQFKGVARKELFIRTLGQNLENPPPFAFKLGATLKENN